MESAPEEYLLIRCFHTEKQFLLFGSYYPSENCRIVFTIIGLFMFFYSWTEFLSMVAVLLVEKDNLTKLSETLLFCMTQAAFLCKLCNFLYNNKKMIVIEELLKRPILNSLDTFEKGILGGYMIQVTYLARLFRVLCILTVAFYGMFPFIDEDPDHMLPLPGWFPFDIKTHQYELVLAQTFGIAIGAFINSTLDILPTILITLASAQFDILKNRLQNVTRIEDFPKGNTVIKMRLDNCILYHNVLLEYIKEVENLFSKGILVQFAASVIVICLTGFQMLVISVKSIQFVLLMIYFSTMTCQIILYCWYGNELMFRSMGLSEACYMSDWNNCSHEICTSLNIIMERGKRPVVLTAGKLFSLTLTTLMTILKSSYSYFAVLQRIYGKNN